MYLTQNVPILILASLDELGDLTISRKIWSRTLWCKYYPTRTITILWIIMLYICNQSGKK